MAGDALARRVAARALARGVASGLSARESSASIGGWAFLPEVVSGRVPWVEARAEEPRPGGFPFDAILLRADGISFRPEDAVAVARGGAARVRVSRLAATGVLGEAALSELLSRSLPGVSVRLERGGAELEAVVELPSGVRARVAFEAAIAVRGGALEISPETYSRPPPPGMESPARRLLTKRIVLPPLWTRFSWEGVEVREGSLAVTVAGRDLTFLVSRAGVRLELEPG